MYSLLRPLLFRLDPERAHRLTLNLLRWAGNFPVTHRLLRALFEVSDPRLNIVAFGLTFKNPVGLAAGYDKNGIAVRGLSALGFGHVEIGTLTLRPQVGNPKPRVHRVPEAHALINSMGFPNDGVDALPPAHPSTSAQNAEQAVSQGRMTRLGINIGKGKDTPLERAADDYCALLRKVYARADYVTINVSSPNTLGLRQLQARDLMEGLLRAVTRVRDELTPRVPLLVKIAPDLNEAELDDVLAATACGIDGLIATNTTIRRDGIPSRYAELKGGLSGMPLRARATEIIRYLAQRTTLPVIGVGGVMNADDALEKWRAGARLVQVYTGLIYRGPNLVKGINVGLLQACERAGARNIGELVQP